MKSLIARMIIQSGIEPIGKMVLHDGGGFTEIWHKDRKGIHILYTESQVYEIAALVAKSLEVEKALEAEIAELKKIVDAAKNLVAIKGRHHSEIAMTRLIAAIEGRKE